MSSDSLKDISLLKNDTNPFDLVEEQSSSEIRDTNFAKFKNQHEKNQKYQMVPKKKITRAYSSGSST
jgi:hypothetical protein